MVLKPGKLTELENDVHHDWKNCESVYGNILTLLHTLSEYQF